MSTNKESIEQGGYKYIKYVPEWGGHILQDKQTSKFELWYANKNHASYGLIYKNTHLEFATELLSFGISKIF